MQRMQQRRAVWFMWLALAFLALRVAQSQPSGSDASGSGSGSEDLYYDDYYEDEEAIDPNGLELELSPEKQPLRYGYKKAVGGGLSQVTQPLMDDDYLSLTVEVHDCVRRMDSGILALEANETEEEEEPGIEQQVIDLRKKMEDVVNIAAALANGTDLTAVAAANATANSTEVPEEAVEGEVPVKRKRMSFREKQERRMSDRRAQLEAREKLRPKFRLGADCETLICGACKVVVKEFGEAVQRGLKDQDLQYVEEVWEGLCASKDVSLRYVDLVADVCAFFQEGGKKGGLGQGGREGYREALLGPFEAAAAEAEAAVAAAGAEGAVAAAAAVWGRLLSRDSVNKQKEQVCVAVGACEGEQFDFYTTPLDFTQQHWDDRCYTCQAFARDLEERVQLVRYVTEGNIVPMVAETCEMLKLLPKYSTACQPLVQGKMLDDVAWLAKVHHESILRQAKAELAFPDKLCQEIDFCEAYMDPEEKREREAQQTMEAVFF
ncbi:hypothetical protein B484DRAFT_455683 [Ochromonadaceae sp. CCMP2298]|nr:hypothetical protein B484DRAFT_455683 [Ochromonadaceae sp. CCMP2298]